jgi:hypothetical protein
MDNPDWPEIKFLESIDNLKGLIKRSIGRAPSTTIASQIAVCIQQGRLFFEAAASSPLQIKPLQLYYGIIAFSKAIIISRTLKSIDTLVPSHGLSDISTHNSSVEKLILRVRKRGTFQEFNDAVAILGRIWYFEHWMPRYVPKPFSNAADLSGQPIDIMEILSRLPALSHLFGRTFESNSNVLSIQLTFDSTLTTQCVLRIDDPELFTDAASLAALIRRRREQYTFLAKWCFSEAVLAWGKSVLTFRNVDRGSYDDITPESLVRSNVGFSSALELIGAGFKDISAFEILPPLSGGITHANTYAIQPIRSCYLSEFSLQFLASYLLSSLVRYRPQSWQHALSRSSSTKSPTDDRSLALLEQFLSTTLSDFPKLVIHAIDYLRAS